MPQGQVKSFSAQKGYGFLSDGKESFFFHRSDLPRGAAADDVKLGDVFTFDDVPGPKGMQAKKLVKIEQHTALQLYDGYIVRKEANPKHGQVVLRVQARSPFFKDPQECRDALIKGAKQAGCNAVLGLTVHRETWSNGNYQHTMHWASADLGLVVEPKPCDPADIAMLSANLQISVDAVQKNAKALVDQFESRRSSQKFPWGLVVLAVLVVLALSYFGML